jgi:2-polyprenyl-3-methyl-5-hydroxy-6-metoxy-1,4-benzoquinol methylase
MHEEGPASVGDESAAALSGIANAYRASALLFAALELDLFSAIPDQGVTSALLAERLEVGELSLRLLLNSLVGLGVLTKEASTFHVHAPFAALLRQGPTYYGNHLLFHKEQSQNWLGMADDLRGRATGPTFYETVIGTGRIQYYLDSVERFNRPYADQLLAHLHPALTRVRTALDIGGGHGYYAQRLLELNDRATVTILDLRPSIEYCRARQRSNPNYPRLILTAGNALTQEYEDAFDLVMMNDLLHYFAMSDKLEITRRATRALHPGGTIAISKFRLDDSAVEPPFSAVLSLRVHLNTQKGFLETDAEAIGLLREVGAHEIRIAALGELKTLITAMR